MKPSPFLIRRLLMFSICALLGVASHARAQAPDPFSDCKKLDRGFHGPAGYDAGTKRWFVSGAVTIVCDGTSVFAEEISWNDTTVFAQGDLLVTQEGLRLTADRMEMDRRTRLGAFFNAHGTARLADAPPEKSLFGTMEPEVWFHAERIERIGPHRYLLTKGSFSTCVQATPRWEMVSTSATIVLDEHAILKNVLFRVKGVPLLYIPYLYYPLKKEDRATGFLIPVYSASAFKGQGISNALFLAISRSMDATLNHDYFSKSGQGVGGDYRYVAAPGSQGNAKVYMLLEKERLAADGTLERPAQRSFRLDASINQRIGRYFQLIGSTNYFSDIGAQQLYQQNVYDFSQRRRSTTLTLSGNVKRFRMNALVQRSDIFTGLTSVQQSGRLPQVTLWVSDAPIGRSTVWKNVYFGAAGEVAYLDTRLDPTQPLTNRSLWRMDAKPTIRAPLSRLSYLRVQTAASWQLTRWFESLDPLTGLPVPVPLTRSLVNLSADVTGPEVARVFRTPNRAYAQGFKHVMTPRVTVDWTSPFDRLNEVILTDHVDRQVGGTTRVSYSLTNTVFAKRPAADGSFRYPTFLSVSISQSYYTNTLAAAFDPQFPTGSVGNFSPIQLSARLAPADNVDGQFQIFIDSATHEVRSLSASTRIHAPRVELTAGWSKRQYLPNVAGFNDPAGASHFLSASTTVQAVDRRVGATYGFYFDMLHQQFLQQRIMAFVNSQCCGIAVDYQEVNISQFNLSEVRKDRRFAITFTLAGIGSFSPPLGGFGR